MAKPYVVLARKYRPQTFEEVLGQPAVSMTLRNAIEGGRIAHAYLFTGPRGVGKTTMARILAKALNCAKGPTFKPCGECQPCKEIASSSCLDVLEMDAASHTGVDNVREVIIETVALAPARDRYKIFIIDEAHMLSGGAFNALLKTIEEPPPHVVFILATTESQKVPATIASRCQRFKFRPVSLEDLAAHLGRLAKSEKIDIAADALELLARSAEGSLRDAVSLLDQAHSYSDKKVSAELVREMFGLVPREMLQGLATALAARDAKALGGWLEKIYEEGVDPAQVLRDLRAGFEGAYLEKLGVGGRADPDWAKALAGASAEQLAYLLKRLNETLADLRTGDSPRLTLELGLFSCLETASDLTQWVQRLEELERRLAAGGAGAARPAPAPAKETAHSQPVSPKPAPAPTPERAPAAPVGPAWPQLLALADKEKPMLAATLAKGRLAAAAEGPWTIVLPREFEANQVRRAQAWVEDKLATIAGRPVKVVVEVGPVAPAETDISQGSVTEASAPQGQWSDAGETPKPAPGPEGINRAAKILGGTTRFVKKKDQ